MDGQRDPHAALGLRAVALLRSLTQLPTGGGQSGESGTAAGRQVAIPAPNPRSTACRDAPLRGVSDNAIALVLPNAAETNYTARRLSPRKWPWPAATEGAPRNRAEKAAFQNTVLEHPVFLKVLERGATVVRMPRLAVAREVDVRRLTSTAAEENRVKPAPAPPDVIVCASPFELMIRVLPDGGLSRSKDAQASKGQAKRNRDDDRKGIERGRTR